MSSHQIHFLLNCPNILHLYGDGVNDVFRLESNGIKKVKLEIRNKCKLLFETADINWVTEIGWDGRHKGKDVRNGNYEAKLEIEWQNGSVLVSTNDFNLIR